MILVDSKEGYITHASISMFLEMAEQCHGAVHQLIQREIMCRAAKMNVIKNVQCRIVLWVSIGLQLQAPATWYDI